jgi:hypothetical protein
MLNSSTRWVCAGLFMFALLASSTRVQGNSAPYLYYYSSKEQAFIIERADGSDSRTLVQYSIPREDVIFSDGSGFIVGPGWSPSEEWFVWTTLLRNGAPSQSAFIVNREGSLPIQLADDLVVDDLQWSPSEDLLLMRLRSGYGEEDTEIIQLYDAQEAKIVFELSVQDIMNSQRKLRGLSWAPDGQHILVINDTTLKVLTLDGADVATLETTLIPYSDCEFGTLPHWLDEKHLAYLQADTTHLIVENIETREQVASIELPSNAIKMVDWSPNHTYAFLYIQSSPGRSEYELWELSLPDVKINLISKTVYFANNCVPPFGSTLWGNNRQTIFISEDKQLRLFDASTKTTVSVAIPTNSELDTFAPVRWTSANEIVLLVRLQPWSRKQIYKYDPQSNVLTLLIPSDPNGSIQTEYISTLHNQSFIYNGSIVDVTHGTQKEILQTPPEFGTLQFDARYIQWHPSGEWLIALSFPSESLYQVYASDADGTTQRGLGRCLSGAKSCYGWLEPE